MLTLSIQLFQNVWPVRDTKQAREFITRVVDALKALEKDGIIPPHLVRPSTIQTCSGERCVFIDDAR